MNPLVAWHFLIARLKKRPVRAPAYKIKAFPILAGRVRRVPSRGVSVTFSNTQNSSHMFHEVLFIMICMLLTHGDIRAGTNDLPPRQTDFGPDATLSVSEMDEVVRLAKLGGIDPVVEVKMVRHLSGVTIEVRGAEKLEGRKATFETLRLYRQGWDRYAVPKGPVKSIGEFWIEETARPEQHERTIVQVGDHILRIGLLNGIKPEGADKVMEAFLKGKVRYASEVVSNEVFRIRMDFTQPNLMGISGGKSWITFKSSLNQVVFSLRDNEVTILEVVRVWPRYE
jgi:hypothetical protein